MRSVRQVDAAKRLLTTVVVVGMMWVSGCAKKKDGTVSGKVVYQGNAVGPGQLLLHGSGNAPVGIALDVQGQFNSAGIPPGDYKVTVEVAKDPFAMMKESGSDPRAGGAAKEAEEEMKKKSTELGGLPTGKASIDVPPKYKDKEQTTLTWKIEAGKNEPKTFTLTD